MRSKLLVQFHPHLGPCYALNTFLIPFIEESRLVLEEIKGIPQAFRSFAPITMFLEKLRRQARWHVISGFCDLRRLPYKYLD